MPQKDADAARIKFLESELDAARNARRKAESRAASLLDEVRKVAGERDKAAMRLDACLFAMVLIQAQVRIGVDREADMAFRFNNDTRKWERVTGPDSVSLAG